MWKRCGDAKIKGAVITSGKDTFCGGADLTLLERLARAYTEFAKSQGEEAAANKLFEESRKLSQLYRGSRPAASHGSPRSTAPHLAAASN